MESVAKISGVFAVLKIISADSMENSSLLNLSGFEEVDFAADWAYRVWGQSLEELLIQAAQGLYSVAGAQIASSPTIMREIQLSSSNSENLLVTWLNELLRLNDTEGLGFNQFKILYLDRETLRISVSGAPVQKWLKFIKAVTYKDRPIRETEAGFEATLILSV